MDLVRIRGGLVVLLGQVPGVMALAYPPESIMTNSGDASTAVCVMSGDPYVDYQQAMKRGLAEIRFELIPVVPKSDIIAAQTRLDELCSSGTGQGKSLIDAIESDSTWGGLVQDSIVDSAGPPREWVWNTVSYLRCSVYIRAYTGRQ